MYPYGANLMSWKLKYGSEVLYARPGDTPLELDGVRPLKCARERVQSCTTPRGAHARLPCRGGVPIYFPQFGAGDGSPGTVPGQAPMQMHGFARNMEWEIIKTVRLCIAREHAARALRRAAHTGTD